MVNMKVKIDTLLKLKLKTAVIGCGRWGTLIAWILSKISEKVYLFGLEDNTAYKQLLEFRKNDYGVELPDNVILTTDLKEALDYAEDFVSIAISGQNFRKFLEINKTLFVNYTGDVVLQMKALENGTGLRLSEIYKEIIDRNDNLVVLLGPAHPQDLVAGKLSPMILSGTNPEVIERVSKKYQSILFKIWLNKDLTGIELGAALKNPIGIMSGILTEFKLEYLLSFLVLRGLAEVIRIVEKKGGSEITATGLSHLGDYFATVIPPYCEFSHNYQYGKTIISGESWEKPIPEGVGTIYAVKSLLGDLTDFPLFDALYRIIDGKLNKEEIKKVIKGLINRSQTEEFHK